MPLDKIKRGGVWHATGTVAGRRVRKSLGTGSEALAEEARIALEGQLMRRAIYGERGLVTFAEAVESYHGTEERSATTRFNVARLLMHFRETALKDINQVAVDNAYKAILKGGAGASGATKLRAVLTPLRAILEHAAIRGWCERPAFEAPRIVKKPKAFLLPSQATALVHHAAPHLRPLLVFLIGTGCRMSEALDLEWPKVDLHGRRASVWQKQGNERHVDLPPVAVTALASLPHREGHVFRPPVKGGVQPARYADMGREGGGQVATAFATACRRAGLPGRMVETANPAHRYWAPAIRVHDLRRTWATWHAAIHRDPYRLMRDGGWSGLAMTQEYVSLMPDAYVDEARAWLAGGVAEARKVG